MHEGMLCNIHVMIILISWPRVRGFPLAAVLFLVNLAPRKSEDMSGTGRSAGFPQTLK